MSVQIVAPASAKRWPRCTHAIVIDVIRATTTANVILSRPHVSELFAVDVPATLAKVKSKEGRRPLIFSEIGKVEMPYERVDNSPMAAKRTNFAGRLPVLVTHNGTRAMGLALKHTDQVWLCCLANVDATVSAMHREGVTDALVVPAGDFARGEPHVEDELCASAFISRLRGEPVDFLKIAATISSAPRIIRRLSETPELRADLDLCLGANSSALVPTVEQVEPRLFRLSAMKPSRS